MTTLLRRPWLLWAACILTGTLTTSFAADRDPGDNAALQYWRAFEIDSILVPEGAHTEVHTLVRAALDGTFTAQTAAYFERVQPYLNIMQRGAKMAYCEWGPYPDLRQSIDSFVAIAHLTEGRRLARIAAARYRHLVHSGNSKEAVALWTDGFQMAEHLDDGGFLVAAMLRQDAQGILVRAAARSLPSLDEAALRDLARLIDDELLRSKPRLAEIYGNDRRMGLAPIEEGSGNEALSAKELEALNELLQKRLGGGKRFSNRSDLKAFLADVEQLHQLVEKALENPDLAAAEGRLGELEDREEFSDGHLHSFLDSALAIVRRERGAEIRLTMLRAAIAIQLNGAVELSRFREPYHGGRFQIVPRFGGRGRYMLQSNYESAGRPVQLEIGPELDSLHEAAAEGDIEQVKYHLQSGAALGEIDENGWAPLHHAASNGQANVVALLLEKGADANQVVGKLSNPYLMDPDMARRYGLTIKGEAAEAGDQGAAREGRTALDLAREAGHADVVELLERAGLE